MGVVVLSLLAALAFAFGAVLQQHGASSQPAERHMRPMLIVGGVLALSASTLITGEPVPGPAGADTME
ncbi:MAG: hypothetical protein ACYDGN_01010 [Acidimicrobiales bacterium]